MCSISLISISKRNSRAGRVETCALLVKFGEIRIVGRAKVEETFASFGSKIQTVIAKRYGLSPGLSPEGNRDWD